MTDETKIAMLESEVAQLRARVAELESCIQDELHATWASAPSFELEPVTLEQLKVAIERAVERRK